MSQFDAESHCIPFDIEAPTPIMFWEPLEFILGVSFMGLGIVMNAFVVGVLCGTGVLVGARYLKRGAKRGAMQHFLWAKGLQLDPNLGQKFKPSWLNDFIE
jgi:hypothetical protein